MKKQSTIFSVVLLLLSLCTLSTTLYAQTAIGGITPDDSAMLDVQSDTRGVLFPRMNISQRGNIMNPATGLMIFNSQTRCLEINLGTPSSPNWTSIKCAKICGAYVEGDLWKEFSCYNLGAVGEMTDADPFTPSWELNGDYYKWGNGTVAAAGPSGNSTPNDAAVVGWSSILPGGDNAWTDYPNEIGSQDPCPEGFRIPSKDQWAGVIAHNVISNPTGATWTDGANNYTSGKFYGPSLFLPATGERSKNNGALLNRNSKGLYWSSNKTPDAWYLVFTDNFTSVSLDETILGLSVRCIAE